MNIVYKHNYDNNIMIIKDENFLLNDYRINMIMKNRINGLLELFVGCANGGAELSYIISSKQSIKELYIKEKMKYAELKLLIEQLLILSRELNLYLLNIDHIILNMEYIYFNIDKNQIEFCYYPNNQGYFYENFKAFLQEIMTITDHNDYSAIELIYGIIEICNNKNYLLNDIENYLVNIEKEKKIIYKEKLPREQINIDIDEDENINSNNEIKNGNKNIYEKENLFSEKIVNILSKLFSKKNSKSKNKKYLEEKIEMAIDNEEEYSETVLITDIIVDKRRKLFSMCEKDDIIMNNYPFILGKASAKVDEVIADSLVSRIHSKIEFENGEFYIEDLNSKNGTFVNDEQLEPYSRRKIVIGDKVTIASFEYIFR